MTSASIGSATASVSSGSDRTNGRASSGDDTASSFAQIFARSTATGADPQKNVSGSSSAPSAPVSSAKTITSAALPLPPSPTAQTAQKIPRRPADAVAVPAGGTSAAAPATLGVLPQAVQPDASGQLAADAPPAGANKVATAPVSAASSAPTNPSSPVNGLAFAMRVKAGGGDQNNNNAVPLTTAGLSTAAPETAPASGPTVSFFTAQLKAAAGSSPGPVPTTGIAAGSGLAIASVPFAATAASPAATTSVLSTPASSSSAVSEPASDNGAATNAPVRGVHVQIAGADDQRVDLRLLERAGSLSVSVRSSDGGVTRNLQDSLPELNSRLAEQHYQTEIWTPPSSFHSSSNDNSDSGQSGAGSGNKNGGSFGNGNPTGQPSGGQPNGQPPGGQQTKQPAWLQELASSGRES